MRHARLLLLLTLVLAAPAGAGPKRALMLLLDGCRGDHLDALLDAGKLPHIRKHVVDRGLRVTNAVTVFPSVTGPAYAPFINGLMPGKAGLPGMRWYDRATGYATVYSSLGYRYLNEHLSQAHRTLYELLPGQTATVFGMADRGVARRNTPYVKMGLYAARGLYLKMDQVLFESFRETLFDGPTPRFAFVSFHAPDSSSHSGGLEHPDYDAGIEQIDAFVGALAKELQARGLYEDTCWVISADHGHTTTTQHTSLARHLETTLGLKVRDTIHRDTATFNLRARWNRTRYDAHVDASGNGFVQLNLVPDGADPARKIWASEVRAFRARNGRTVDVEAGLLASPAVEIVASRAAPGVYRVASVRGASEVRRDGDALAYRVTGGEDPLGYTGHPQAGALIGGASHPARAWLDATATTQFPDAPYQLAAILDGARTGDVVVSSTPGWEPWPQGQGGLHGTLRRAHMHVPLLIGGAGVRTARLHAARTVDVFPTLCEILELPAQPDIEGRALPWR
jgi:hypothetical protein